MLESTSDFVQHLVENERRYRREAECMARLHALALRLGETPDMREALLAVLQTAIESQAAQFGVLSLYDEHQGCLHVRASMGFDEDALAMIANLVPTLDAGACGRAFVLKSRVVVQDTETDPLFENFRDVARHVGFRAVQSTPIVTRRGEALGVLSVHYPAPQVPDSRDRALVDVCARHAADVIETARGHQQLADADRRKDEFIAALANELRNPLAPIMSAVGVLGATDDPRQAEKCRVVIERQVRQLARTVDDLLDISRISTGTLELQRERLDLREILSLAIDASRPLIDAGRHPFVLDVAEGALWVEGDRARLTQVFSNLLNNAARYSLDSTPIGIVVRTHKRRVEVTVWDEGIGLARERLHEIFEPFVQAERPADRPRGGLGVGLTLARELVHLHDGAVTAHSEGPGHGSQFVVRLPLAPVAATARAAGPHPAFGVVQRVLVVDDNRDAAEMLCELVRTLGHDVEAVWDGLSAIDRASTFRPHVILLDLGMPHVTGYEIATALREMPQFERVKLVAVTGWGQHSDRARTREAGFDDHLVKPLALDDLRRALAPRGVTLA